MFLRYFLLTMTPSSFGDPKLTKQSRSASLISISSIQTEKEGRNLIVWDIAVGCLSLSVKVRPNGFFRTSTAFG